MVTAAERARARAKAAARLDRREKVWTLRCQGWTEKKIAREFGVHQTTISRDLKWLCDRALKSLDARVLRAKVEHIEMLEHAASECFAAWEESKARDSAVTKKTKSVVIDDGNAQGTSVVKPVLEDVTTRVTKQTGKVGYLREARELLADVRKILGADAPLKIAPTSPDGKDPVQVILYLPVEEE